MAIKTKQSLLSGLQKKGQREKGETRRPGKQENLWQHIFGICFGYAELFSYEEIKFVSISTLVAAVFSYFVSVSSLFVMHAFLVSFLTVSFSGFVYAHTLLILKLISV